MAHYHRMYRHCCLDLEFNPVCVCVCIFEQKSAPLYVERIHPYHGRSIFRQSGSSVFAKPHPKCTPACIFRGAALASSFIRPPFLIFLHLINGWIDDQ